MLQIDILASETAHRILDFFTLKSTNQANQTAMQMPCPEYLPKKNKWLYTAITEWGYVGDQYHIY